MGAFCLSASRLFGFTCFLTQRTVKQKVPGRDTGRLKNQIRETKVVHCSSGKAFGLELHMHAHYKDAFFRSNWMDADRMRQLGGYDLLGHWSYA